VLLVDRDDETILLLVRPLRDGSIGLFLSSQAPRCRFPDGVFELPIQINETGFQLKHAIRPEQKRDDGDGSCTEAIATSYRPEHYWPLKTATSVTLHLPWGPLPLSEAALAHLKTVTPARPAEALPADGDIYSSAINRLNMMLSAGQARQARESAEVLLPAFASRPPNEGFGFFAMLGMARRMTGDLAFAASSFEVAIMLSAMTKDVPNVGAVWDNLAIVRRLQKRWPDAEQASDRAIAALETIDNPKARMELAEVYNNRALLLLEQTHYEPALAYSEKALAILTVMLKNQPKELEPFLEDNRKIREKLGSR
jgi:tetratricopeptide (TPR) repeat protein